ncbi:MAG: Pyrrolo-quinoline quinone [Planctomycetaceae bacterium]|nr:Pyrrolo-quinoline quinone [Planctomycetaceae bacterium]
MSSDRNRRSTFFAIALVLPLLLSQSALAGEWPQILGPTRNGIAQDEKPIEPWAAAGPKRVWSREVGQGFAGPAVVGDRVIVFHRVDDSERVEAIDRKTGRSLWHQEFEASYRGTINPDVGPRCVPLVHGDSIYVFGAAGDLHCVALADGKNRWSRAAYSDYRGDEGYFGAGATPIVADNKLLVNVGGDDAGLVAFDLKTGKTVWQVTDEAASYSSPSVARVAGQTHVVFITRMNTVSIDPRDGSERFRFPFGRSGPTVNAATPLLWGDRLFVASSYGVGAQLWQIGASSAKRIWDKQEVMSSQYTTCVYRDGFLYGCHGREDYQNGELRCIDAKTGEVRWSFDRSGVAHVILVGDRLLIVGIDGTLRLAQADPGAFKELAKAELTSTTMRALPAYSNGRLYIRTTAGELGKLFCFQLAE